MYFSTYIVISFRTAMFSFFANLTSGWWVYSIGYIPEQNLFFRYPGISTVLHWRDTEMENLLPTLPYLEGTLVGGCRCATSWCNLDLTFDLAVVTLTYKILSMLYLGNCKV